MRINPEIARQAVRSGGYLTRAQAESAGMSASAIDRAVRSGTIEVVAEGVYRMVPLDGVEPLLQGALLALPGAVVSHEGAATLHGFPHVAPKAVVSVHRRTTHRFPGVYVRRTFDLADDHVTRLPSGLLVTTMARTVVDLAAALRPRLLQKVVEDLVVEQRIDLVSVSACLDSVARRGKPGVSVLREILAGPGLGSGATSILEKIGLEMLTRSGLPTPAVQYPAPWDERQRLDAAYPCCRLGVEWDSRRWHTAPDRFDADRRRDRQALGHGWAVLRFTWGDVTRRRDEVASDIRIALAARGHASHQVESVG